WACPAAKPAGRALRYSFLASAAECAAAVASSGRLLARASAALRRRQAAASIAHAKCAVHQVFSLHQMLERNLIRSDLVSLPRPPKWWSCPERPALRQRSWERRCYTMSRRSPQRIHCTPDKIEKGFSQQH